MTQKLDPELLNMTKTPDALYQEQRRLALSKAKEVLQGLMVKLQMKYDGKPFKWVFPDNVYSYTDAVKELVVEAMQAQGWRMKKDRGRSYTITKGSAIQPGEAWYGTLKIAGEGTQGLLVVKTNPEMETGYDILNSHLEGSLKEGDDVHLLDEDDGWSWIGRLHENGVPVEIQALELLKLHHEGGK